MKNLIRSPNILFFFLIITTTSFAQTNQDSIDNAAIQRVLQAQQIGAELTGKEKTKKDSLDAVYAARAAAFQMRMLEIKRAENELIEDIINDLNQGKLGNSAKQEVIGVELLQNLKSEKANRFLLDNYKTMVPFLDDFEDCCYPYLFTLQNNNDFPKFLFEQYIVEQKLNREQCEFIVYYLSFFMDDASIKSMIDYKYQLAKKYNGFDSQNFKIILEILKERS